MLSTIPLITLKMVKQDRDGWANFYSQLGNFIQKVEEDKKEEEWRKEYQDYRGETKAQRDERASQPNEWILSLIRVAV